LQITDHFGDTLTVVTSCAQLTSDPLAIAKFLVINLDNSYTASAITPGNAEYSHDSDDSWVDGDNSGFHLLQDDPYYRQQHDGYIQLIPPTKNRHSMPASSCSCCRIISIVDTTQLSFLILLKSDRYLYAIILN